jgi:hypothetical protein
MVLISQSVRSSSARDRGSHPVAAVPPHRPQHDLALEVAPLEIRHGPASPSFQTTSRRTAASFATEPATCHRMGLAGAKRTGAACSAGSGALRLTVAILRVGFRPDVRCPRRIRVPRPDPSAGPRSRLQFHSLLKLLPTGAGVLILTLCSIKGGSRLANNQDTHRITTSRLLGKCHPQPDTSTSTTIRNLYTLRFLGRILGDTFERA